MTLVYLLIILALCLVIVFMSVRMAMVESENNILREQICFDKSDLHSAWNGGYVEGVHSEAGHETKSFNEWYQMHKFVKKYGKK